MSRALALDLTRLMLGLLRATPRGIDRIEFGYADHYLRHWPGECVVLLPTPWGVRCYERAHGLRIIDLAARLWREDANNDGMAARVEVWLHGTGPRPTARGSAAPTLAQAGRAVRGLFADVGFQLGRPAAEAVPKNAIYLNVGQSGLAARPLLAWLDRRSDVKPVFMLHDVIPLEFPEYVPPFETRQFRKIVANTARYAAGLIGTTEAALRSIRARLQAHGRDGPASIVIAPPTAEAFLAGSPAEARADLPPYFICCGSIEPRKNQMLLLQVWRTLAERSGDATPKLVLAGARWRAGEPLIAMLERSEPILRHVCEAPGLPTPALRRLLRGARAALTPSLAEGFGLPIVEALSVGTPVLASDLPPHREAGGTWAMYLSPLDGLGWRREIEKLAAEDAAARRAPLAAYRPWRWSDYFGRLTPFLESIGRPGGRP
jgi:glycosyltransferase involved in cell wall biosynthesis